MTPARKFARAAALALALAVMAASAQVRTIPAEAKRGQMRHLQEMTVDINGRAMQLAPGAQIRDASNLVVMPSALPARSLVKFTLDANGHVSRVWILTAQEAAQADRRR
ncbi:MAG: hypothetical protein EPO27_12180 [Betaproteobacteria bacterium]|nr:MAG: hypothetical protein EPO27_12180 [Betaproteobacteria bacterium]